MPPLRLQWACFVRLLSGSLKASNQNIKNKVVIITGASSGIGEATAYKLAKEGAKIVLGAP